MSNLVPLEPVDYLVIGHVAHDLTPEGPRLGGTVAYSALTARALGLRVGVVTASGPETQWDDEARVSTATWLNPDAALTRASAVVISREDVDGNDELIEHMAHQTRVLAVTEDSAGAVLFWNGDRRRFRAPEVHEVDATGAGDVFAAAFFVRLFTTRDPWEATRFATLIASHSVTRVGLDGIPTPHEIEESIVEVLH